MIRVLFGAVLLSFGLLAAAAFVGPSLLAGPRGEPLMVASGDDALLKHASLACGSNPNVGDELSPRVFAMAVPSAAGGVTVVLRTVPASGATADTALFIDRAGEVSVLGPTDVLRPAVELPPECLDEPEAEAPGAI